MNYIKSNGAVYMSLGTKLRSLRKDYGYSADYLGELAGCTQSTISDIELDKRSPTYDTIVKIASALNVPVIDVLPVEAHKASGKSYLTEQEKIFVENLHLLSADHRQIVMKLMESLLPEKK
jgi:transcriptional regulator with XRE-family HTH domain